jgi:ADP-ribose pyrophosphatase YjhB (NUDIX family)
MNNLVEDPQAWKFVVRVYAIILNEQNEVLLTDEFFRNTFMTKFPGGGLEFGEGTIDCLKREAIEEFGQEIEVIRHFYTTDFFQNSLFHDKGQLISIYYMARFTGPILFKTTYRAFDHTTNENGSITFRWKPVAELTENEVTYPVDKHVVYLIRKEI